MSTSPIGVRLFGTERDRQRANLTNEAIRTYMLEVAGDECFLATVAAQGEDYHRRAFMRAFGGSAYAVDEGIANAIYRYFRERARKLFRQKYDMTPQQFLDAVEIELEPTEEEIENAWEHEIESSEECMRMMYPHESARTRKGKDVGKPKTWKLPEGAK